MRFWMGGFEKVAFVLDNERLPNMVIGGQAVLLHGEPRLTNFVERSTDNLRLVNDQHVATTPIQIA